MNGSRMISRVFVALSILSAALFPIMGVAQQKPQAPSPTPIETGQPVQADTAKGEELPQLEMQEYIITGKEQLPPMPVEELNQKPEYRPDPEESIDVTETPVSPDVGKDITKASQFLEVPTTGVQNYVYGSYGRYQDIRAGTRLVHKKPTDEFIFTVDFSQTDGFRKDADRLDGVVQFSDQRRVSDNLVAGFSAQYHTDIYKLYGAEIPGPADGLLTGEDLERSYSRIIGTARLDVESLSAGDISLEGRLRGGKISDAWGTADDAERGLYGRIDFRGFYGRTILTANGTFDGNYLKRDGRWKRSNLTTGTFSIETSLQDQLIIGAGVRGYIVQDTRGNSESKVYPYGQLTKPVTGIGELFVEYAPEVTSNTLMKNIERNPYLDARSLFSYELHPMKIRGGWRKQMENNVRWEVSYIYDKIENMGIEVPSLLSDGVWQLEHGYESKASGIQVDADWSASDMITLWGTARIIDYTNLEGSRGTNVPYHANVTAEGAVDIYPGHGIRFQIVSKYIGSRKTDTFGTAELDPYFLTDLTLGKKFGPTLEVAVRVFNVFNEKYSHRLHYREPDIVSAGELRFYW